MGKYDKFVTDDHEKASKAQTEGVKVSGKYGKFKTVPTNDINLPAGDLPMEEGRKGEEQIASLPAPTPEMYRGMDPDKQRMFYEAYKRHPNSETDFMGNVTYKGMEVPNGE